MAPRGYLAEFHDEAVWIVREAGRRSRPPGISV